MKTLLHAMVIYDSTVSESSSRLLIIYPLSPYRLQLSLGVINDFRCSIVLSLITLCAPHLDAIITTSSVPPTVIPRNKNPDQIFLLYIRVFLRVYTRTYPS